MTDQERAIVDLALDYFRTEAGNLGGYGSGGGGIAPLRAAVVEYGGLVDAHRALAGESQRIVAKRAGVECG